VSISSMTKLAVEAEEIEAARAEPGWVADASAGKPTNTVQEALDKIADYIPAEALAIYVAALGILLPQTETERWATFAFGLGLVVIFTWLGLTNRRRRKPQTRTFWWLLFFGFLAFTLYAGALPNSPFLTLTDAATRILSVAALVAAYVIPEAAERLHLRPLT
jgi:hypothetical protein